jgi:phosphotransferase system HPr (HPr) family protein
LTKDGKTANAKSMIDILTLVAGKDSEVCISADGPDETAAVTALADLLSGSENK